MIHKTLLIIVSALWLPIAGQAQQSKAAVQLQIRAVLHDPVNPVAELFLPDQTGAIVKLNLMLGNLSVEQTAILIDDSLVLYNTEAVDPKNPQASVAATVKVPSNIKQAIVIVVPGPANSKPAYRMIVLDNSATAFPKGESRIISLIGVEAAIEAGEHKLPLTAGKITPLPAVKKVNEFNMAQTNFYYKENTSWVAFSERQLQYLDEFHRIFIVHVTPGAIFPTVTTIVDVAPAKPIGSRP